MTAELGKIYNVIPPLTSHFAKKRSLTKQPFGVLLTSCLSTNAFNAVFTLLVAGRWWVLINCWLNGEDTRLHCPTADRYKKRRIRLSPYAEMTTDDWQTYDKPVLRCKAKTTPANSGRKDRNHLSVDVSIYIHILSIDQWVIQKRKNDFNIHHSPIS